MDTLNKGEIEAALAARLPSYRVECSLHPDGTLSAILTGPASDHFAIIGIVRSNYCGTDSITKLAREILEEMVLARKRIKICRLPLWSKNDDLPPHDCSCSAPDLKKYQESVSFFESCPKEMPL
jgi:hypothetical protein